MNRPLTANSSNMAEMMSKAKRQQTMAQDPLDKLRSQLLARGATGILGFGRVFRRMDDNGNRSLCFDEFCKGIEESGVKTEDGCRALFDAFDKDRSGSVCINEFLKAIRPPMSDGRKRVIAEAFKKLDRTGDGVVTLEDLNGVYNVKHNPRYLSGEETEEQILKKFLANFESNGSIDGMVTYDEFLDYYAGVSSSIDHDAYFDLMMRQAWKM
ncbi:calcyphosin-like protein [Daphnia carinata]|uniref:calcyphosin-like protein n=1 Tax=Daphnia carinata TaxID=120202 RepID=UPI00257AC4B0|nr:calcyphosin-like protein [Daphnia carinata]